MKLYYCACSQPSSMAAAQSFLHRPAQLARPARPERHSARWAAESAHPRLPPPPACIAAVRCDPTAERGDRRNQIVGGRFFRSNPSVI